MPLKKQILFILLLLYGISFAGCASRRLNLKSFADYSQTELTTFISRQIEEEYWPKITTLKAWFKVKITTKKHKDFFRGALYWQAPDTLRLERWGMMHQLEGIVVSRENKVIVKVPYRHLYLTGNSKDIAHHFWGEDILLDELPDLLTGKPHGIKKSNFTLKTVGRLVELALPQKRYLLGFHPLMRNLVYLAKIDQRGEKIWEVFYDQPKDFNGVKLMSRAELLIAPHTKIELKLQKLYINPQLKPSLFEMNIPPQADVEPLKGSFRW